MEHIPSNYPPILVVDSDVETLISIKDAIVDTGFPEPALVSEAGRVIDLLRVHQFPLVLLELTPSKKKSLDLLKKVKLEFPFIECIVVSNNDDVSATIETIKLGAYGYLVKPLDNERMFDLISQVLERLNIHRQKPSSITSTDEMERTTIEKRKHKRVDYDSQIEYSFDKDNWHNGQTQT